MTVYFCLFAFIGLIAINYLLFQVEHSIATVAFGISLFLVLTAFSSPNYGFLALLASLLGGGWYFARPPVSDANYEIVFVLAALAGFFLRRIVMGKSIRTNAPAIILFALSVVALIAGGFALSRYLFFNLTPALGYLNVAVNPLGLSSDFAIKRILTDTFIYFAWGGVFLYSLNLTWDSKFRKKFFILLIAGVLANLMIAGYQFFVSQSFMSNPQDSPHGRVSGLIGNYNSMGFAAAVMIVFSPFLVSTFRKKGFALVLLIALVSPLVLLSGSRAALLYVLLAFFGAGAVIVKKSRNFRVPALITITVAIALFLILPNMDLPDPAGKYLERFSIVNLLDNNGKMKVFLNGRQEMWALSGQAIAEYPVSGIGAGSFIVESSNILPEGYENHTLVDNALSFYFHTTAELGFTGGLLALAALLSLLLVRTRYESPTKDVIPTVTAIPVWAVLIPLAFGPHFIETEPMMLFWGLSAALMIKAKRLNEGEIPFKGAVLGGSLAIVAVLVVFNIFTMFQLNPAENWQKHPWHVDSGFYPLEKEGEQSYRWTDRKAAVSLDQLHGLIHVKWRAAIKHEASDEQEVTFYLNDEVLSKELVTDFQWHDSYFVVEEFRGKKGIVGIDAGAVCRPSEILDSFDNRELGVQIAVVESLDFDSHLTSGFYPWEQEEKRKYQWSGGTGYRHVLLVGPEMELEIRAGHPDITSFPVTVKIEILGVVEELVALKSNSWKKIRLDVSTFFKANSRGGHAILKVTTDRLWQPGGETETDTRELGVAISELTVVAQEVKEIGDDGE